MEMATHHTLADRTVLITGAAKRIGAALARGLHADGANIIVHYRSSPGAAQTLAAELNDQRSNSAMTVQADLLAVERIAEMVEEAAGLFDGLDALINNASTFYPTPVGTVTAVQWEEILGSNLRAPFFLAQAAAPHLAARAGAIINMIDIHAKRPLRDYSVYCTAKAGLAMLTRALARELGPRVRVNGIAPGAILWPASGLDEQTRAKIIDRTALKRAGSPDDIVHAARFLLADADYVTGHVIAVDGGRSIGW